MSWLNFGTYESLAVDIFPGLIHSLREKMPELKLGLRISRTANLLTMVNIVSPSNSPSISPFTDTMVKQFGLIADFEQWMRIFAVQHTVGNWDSYGYNRGKNAYTYRPNFGKFGQGVRPFFNTESTEDTENTENGWGLDG